MKEKISQKLLQGILEDPITKCWNWQKGFKDRKAKFQYGGIVVDKKCYRTHRVAAWCWLGFDLHSSYYVLHKCDNPKCINPEHLFIGTHDDNMKDMARKKRSKNQKGSNNPRAKYTPEQVFKIIELRKEGLEYQEISKLMNASKTTIGEICRGEHWVVRQNGR